MYHRKSLYSVFPAQRPKRWPDPTESNHEAYFQTGHLPDRRSSLTIPVYVGSREVQVEAIHTVCGGVGQRRMRRY